MRVLGLFLAVMSFLVPIAAQAEPKKDSGDPVQAVLDRLGKMELQEQQAWLKRLEERAGRAAQLTLQPDEATLQQKKTRSKLHQKMVTWQVLREVIEDTNTREKDVIDRLEAGIQDAAKPQAAEEPAAALPERNPAAAQVPLQRRDGDPRHVEQRPSTDAPSRPPTVTRRSEPSETPATDVTGPPLPRHEIAPIRALPPKVDEDVPQKVANIGLPTETRVQPPSMIESPSQTAVSLNDELPPDSVEIKVDELAARIGGCNMAFRALEMELDEKGVWTAARLEPLVERLEMLAIRRSDLSLFREAVPDEKRSSLDPLPPLKIVVSQVATRIVEARRLASGSSFKGTDSERQAELKRLEGLSRRLAKLTEQP